MEAGLDVYCEKEMSNSLDKARDMVLAQRRTGKLLQIGHQRRSNPRYIHAIDGLVHGEKLIGRVTQANGQWNRAKSEDLGWPKRYTIPPETLQKYGYDSMSHFRNWRWYKKYGGGPIVDLGSHQIDIFTWVFGHAPKSVMASGGIDFYHHHEWYDNVMAIYEYENEEGVSRAFYQVLTTTSNGGFYETFMGEDGSLVISEVPPRGNHFLREVHANQDRWDQLAKNGQLVAYEDETSAETEETDTLADVRLSKDLGAWDLPIVLNKPVHQPHLENFFDAIRKGTPLSCPAEVGYETAVEVLTVNRAVELGQRVDFKPEDFVV
jgi:predicted dehydrogenase